MLIRSLEDAQRELSILRSQIDSLLSQNIDLHGRRIMNAGKSEHPHDLVRKDELEGIAIETVIRQVPVVLQSGSPPPPPTGDGLTLPVNRHIPWALDRQFDIAERVLRVRWGFASVWNAHTLQVENTRNNAFWRIDMENAGIGSEPNWLYIRNTVNSPVIKFNNLGGVRIPGNLTPDKNKSSDLGSSLLLWDDANIRRLTLGEPSSISGADPGILRIFNASNTGNVSFTGAALDGGPSVGVSGSLRILTSGNFYGFTFSGGDASCSGVTSGWMGIRTDTNEIQICIGGVLKKVALT